MNQNKTTPTMLKFGKPRQGEMPKKVERTGFVEPVGYIKKFDNTVTGPIVVIVDNVTKAEKRAVLVSHRDVNPETMAHEDWDASEARRMPNGTLIMVDKHTCNLLSKFDIVFKYSEHPTEDGEMCVKTVYLMNNGFKMAVQETLQYSCAHCGAEKAMTECVCTRVRFCDDVCRFKSRRKTHPQKRCEELYTECVVNAAAKHRKERNNAEARKGQ